MFNSHQNAYLNTLSRVHSSCLYVIFVTIVFGWYRLLILLRFIITRAFSTITWLLVFLTRATRGQCETRPHFSQTERQPVLKEVSFLTDRGSINPEKKSKEAKVYFIPNSCLWQLRYKNSVFGNQACRNQMKYSVVWQIFMPHLWYLLTK